MATDYPAPSDPGKVQTKPAGPAPHAQGLPEEGQEDQGLLHDDPEGRQQGQGRRHRQRARRHLLGGREIQGAKKRYLTLVGNVKHPDKVLLDATKIKKATPPRATACSINGANEVTVDGFTAQHYNGNGFFVTNATGYTSTT